MHKSILLTVLVAASCIAAPVAGRAAEVKGTSVTQGGSRPFCKGSTPITGSIDGANIAIRTPLAAGGTATARGRIDKSGAFKASGARFTFTGSARGNGASGNWKGPSCYGTFRLG